MVKLQLCLALMGLLNVVSAQRTLLPSKTSEVERPHLTGWVVLQNAGTGKYISTSLSGDHENSTLVQHAKRKLPIKANNPTGTVSLSTESGNMIGIPGASLKERCPAGLLRPNASGTRWAVEPRAGETVVFRNTDSQQVLAVKDGSSEDYAELIQERPNGSKRQIWKVIKVAEDPGK